jgi:hypothetical protein
MGYGINPFDEPVDPGPEVPDTPVSWGVGNQVCNLAADPGNLISPDEDCGHTYTVDEPWDVEVEWTFGDGTELSHHAVHVPLVANLTDTNYDGKINTEDVPNVVLPTWSQDYNNGALVVLNGANGELVWQAEGIHAIGGHTLGDIDADGFTDIVAFDNNKCPILFDRNGNVLWTATECSTVNFPQTTIADLQGDQTPEVITEHGIYDGKTGALKVAFHHDFNAIPYTMPSIGDIDLDGEQEVVLGNRVYSPDGTIEWSAPIQGQYGHWSAILNVDDDPEAEVLMIGDGKMAVYEHQGDQKSVSETEQTAASPPCAADFDGDGLTEIAWAAQGEFYVYRLDGSQLWKTPILDHTGLSGCAGYDVNGDGAYEIIYADESIFYILDGATGDYLYTNEDHGSPTAFEYPSIADVDNDGSAEILFSSASSITDSPKRSLTVLGHRGDGWAPSGSSWPGHDFAVSNVHPNGNLPKEIPLYWLDQNVYRARPIVDTWNMGVDLAVQISDVCYEGCEPESMVQVAIQVTNNGIQDSYQDIPVSLYSVDGDDFTLLETFHVDAIPAATQNEGLILELTVEQGGKDGYVVRVDDDGSGFGIELECAEDNNQDIWLDLPC